MKFKWIKDFFLTNKKVLEPTLNVEKVNLDLEILELLIEIARIDGKLTLDEIALIKSFIVKSPILDANLIQDYIKNTAEKISLSENINLINSNLTKEEVLEIIFELFQLSFIDEDIHLEEERLIYKIADLLRVKRHEITMIKNRVLERSV